ncbi:MAG: hypothetical protein ACKO0V_02375 [bacterium]
MTDSGLLSSSDQTTPAQVASAVMAVLRELNTHKTATLPNSGSPVLPKLQSVEQSVSHHTFKPQSEIKQFSGSLLLERHALELEPGLRELAILPKTVVTPLAREILKKKGISTRLVGSAGIAGITAVSHGQWAILRLSASSQAVAAESMMAGRTGEGWDVSTGSLDDAAAWLGNGEGRHLGILAEAACVTVWRLARAGIRSARACAADEVESIVKNFAPQSLVVESAKMPIHEIKQVFQTWRRMGVVSPPRSVAIDDSAEGAGQ